MQQRKMEGNTLPLMYCLLCNNTSSRLHCLTNPKAVKEKYTTYIEKTLDCKLQKTLLGTMHACEKCMHTCKNYYQFKKTSNKNITEFQDQKLRLERLSNNVSMASSSVQNIPDTTPKRKTVAAQIQDSVERFKRLKLTDITINESCQLEKSILSEHAYNKPDDCQELQGPITDSCTASDVIEVLKKQPSNTLSQTLDKQLSEVCRKGKSLLFNRNVMMLSAGDIFMRIIKEMKEACPQLFEILLTCIGDKVSTESKIATLATMYGMVMHSRNVKACGIQRIFTALAIRFHADNKLLERLNKVHVTLSHETKRNIMDDLANHTTEQLREKVTKGKDGKLNGDNLDIYVTTNEVRLDNKNKDLHFFASDFTFDRVDIKELESTKPLKNIANVTPYDFVPSGTENDIYKKSLKVLIGRIIVDYIDYFKWMKPVLPSHIPHPLEDDMEKKSEIFWLPVMIKNEAYYSDCVQIMDDYEKQLADWYTKAGRGCELDGLKVPVGGDQLTRVRLQGAKALRAGALTPEDRFEHLEPVIVEMFHTQQDLLEKLYKRFYSSSSGRERGTLHNLKIHIQRSNVNANVKSRFEAHEDFVLTVGHAYLLSYIMDHFHMKSLQDTPKHPKLKENMAKLHTNFKEDLCNDILEEIINDLLDIFAFKDPEVKLKVTISGKMYYVKSKYDGEMLNFRLLIRQKECLFNVHKAAAERGVVVQLQGEESSTPVHIQTVTDDKDDLLDYVLQFLQWFFLVISMKDAIKEGDIERNNVHLKVCVPFFYSHSSLSKYMEECIDYILKTEVMLSEKLALKVRAGSFVNLTGRKGDNKAADMQKENEVLVLKDLIRGLGANKTEKAIVTISKAAPVIQSITDNVDSMLGIINKRTRHKRKSYNDDVTFLLNELNSLNIWHHQNNRQLNSFHGISRSPFSFVQSAFKQTIMRMVDRLKRGIALPDINDTDSD